MNPKLNLQISYFSEGGGCGPLIKFQVNHMNGTLLGKRDQDLFNL